MTVVNRAVSQGLIGADFTAADRMAIKAEQWNETIDELVIYDRALTGDDVAAHYAAIPEPGSVGLLMIGLLSVLGLRRRK